MLKCSLLVTWLIVVCGAWLQVQQGFCLNVLSCQVDPCIGAWASNILLKYFVLPSRPLHWCMQVATGLTCRPPFLERTAAKLRAVDFAPRPYMRSHSSGYSALPSLSKNLLRKKGATSSLNRMRGGVRYLRGGGRTSKCSLC